MTTPNVRAREICDFNDAGTWMRRRMRRMDECRDLRRDASAGRQWSCRCIRGRDRRLSMRDATLIYQVGSASARTVSVSGSAGRLRESCRTHLIFARAGFGLKKFH